MALLMISVKKAIRSILLQEKLFCLPSPPLPLSPYTLVSLLLLGSNCQTVKWQRSVTHVCTRSLSVSPAQSHISAGPFPSPTWAGSPEFLSLSPGFISIQICCYFSHLKSLIPTELQVSFQGPLHFSNHHQSESLKKVVPFSISCHSSLNVLHPSLGLPHSVETALGRVP